jgi:hypothetical protein
MRIDFVPQLARSCSRLGKPWLEAVAIRRAGLLSPHFVSERTVFGRAFAGSAFPPGGKS